MSAYYLFDVREILDQNKLSDYRSKVFATVEQYGGRYLVLGGRVEKIEGEWAPSIPVIEFPSAEAARAWYQSDEYRSLLELRLEASNADAVLLEGFNCLPTGQESSA